jgi:gamma-glutamyltranspeptidase / glutathione hydrolase
MGRRQITGESMRLLNRNLPAFGTLFGLILVLGACGNSPEELGTEGYVQGFIGGVAADEPRAVLEGQKILSAGGSAADAATAVYFTLAVTLPSKASLGGGGVCMVFDHKTKKIEALDFLSRVPANIPPTASRPSAVPGNPLGIFALHTRYGRFQWAGLVAIGEKLARFGTQASRSLVTDLNPVAGALVADLEARKVFLQPNGKMIGEGSFMRQIDLSTALSSLRQRGPADFYQGKFARQLVAGVRQAGGSLSLSDLRAFKPQWKETLVKKVGNHQIHFMPPPASGGLVAAQMFGMLDDGDLFDDASADEKYHVLAETALRSYGDRERWLREDFSIANPPKTLISDRHLDQLIGNYQASRHLSPEAFQPAPKQRAENPSATSFVVIDREGSAVACALTMNNSFGIGRMAKGTGIMLAAAPTNRGKGPTALGPILVHNRSSNNIFFAGAASGGIAAPTALMNVFGRAMLAGEKLGRAMSAPRVHHGGAPDVTFYEPSMDASTKSYLTQRGHHIAATPILGLVNAVYCSGGLPRDPGTCVIQTDPRGSGLASNASE